VAFEKKEIFIRKREREKKRKSDYIMFDAQVLRILLDDSSIHPSILFIYI
jgi:hypothetical protein